MTSEQGMNLQSKRQDILRIAARHGARNLRLFGSAARGEDRPESDLDLLVEMESGRSLLDLVGPQASGPDQLNPMCLLDRPLRSHLSDVDFP